MAEQYHCMCPTLSTEFGGSIFFPCNIFHIVCTWPRFDLCCFYYFVRNSLVALLEALGARMFPWDSWISVFSWQFFFVYVCKVSLYQSLSSVALNQAPVPGCRHSSCVLIVHVCLCVCASVCACENVLVKWWIFSKYKQNRDDVTCSINIENRNRCS